MPVEVWILHVNRKRSRTRVQNVIFSSFLSPSSSLAPRDRLSLAPLGIRLYTRVFLALFLLNARPIHPRSTPWRLELLLMKKTCLQAIVESFKLTEEINALSLSLCRAREMCTPYKSCNECQHSTSPVSSIALMLWRQKSTLSLSVLSLIRVINQPAIRGWRYRNLNFSRQLTAIGRGKGLPGVS